MFIYQYLRTVERSVMPSDLAQALSISVNQANYGLRKLRQFGLLRRLSGGWCLVDDCPKAIEARVLELTGVAGKGQERAARFQREREIFAGRLLEKQRLRVEKEVFMDAVKFLVRCEKLLEDPLVAEGLVLGAAIQMEDGSFISLEPPQ
jgi:hypothetical protein